MKKPSTPVKTPVKILKRYLNDYCRVCRLNIKINGLSQVNIFEREFFPRFELVSGVKCYHDELSQVICQKCFRTVVRLETALKENKCISLELQKFRKEYQAATNQTIVTEVKKRCAKESPTSAGIDNNRKKSRGVESSRRKILSFVDSNIENHLCHVDTSVFTDEPTTRKLETRTEVRCDFIIKT